MPKFLQRRVNSQSVPAHSIPPPSPPPFAMTVAPPPLPPPVAPQPRAERAHAHADAAAEALAEALAALEAARPGARFTLGVCALDRKARSPPMLEILSRLPAALVRVRFFGDAAILGEPVERWPACDALVAFFSQGFPLDKARQYVALRKPVVVNDLDTQHLLMDRREVYRVLREHGVPTPRHVVLSRDGYNGAPEPVVVEGDDFIEVNGERIAKPFVEKPVDGEDHNINIYYPLSAGGGCKRLFRKVGNRSSEYDGRVNHVRQGGSFIYEEFLSTQGTDVKVYTVGPNYAHAEARKSPVLDGRVVRDQDGKEVRYPVILSPQEKHMARSVCRAFRQTVCGFDILRVRGQAFVCDVNGWSFVKNSPRFYDDAAVLLAQFLDRALSGRASSPVDALWADDHAAFGSLTLRVAGDDAEPHAEMAEPPMATHKAASSDGEQCAGSSEGEEPNQSGYEEELRCVLAVIRHGDRTPKQKMKMHVCHPLFLDFYAARAAGKTRKDLKIKAVADLEHLLDVSKQLLAKFESREPEFMAFLAERERGFGEDASDRVQGLRTLRDVLQRWRLVGINRKVQLKPKEVEDETGRVRKLLLVIKWGGDLTHMGKEQAELLGQKFRRVMYPGGEAGLNRLHSTYRHDLKIYTSDEGRVQKTAASFAKGLLELEGDLIPILVGLVLKSKDADSMLDQSGSAAQEIIVKVKQRLHKIIHRDDHCSQLLDSESRLIRSVALALQQVDQPIKKMTIMHGLLKALKEQLTRMLQQKAQLRAELSKRQAQTAATKLRQNLPSVERSLSVSSMLSNPRRRHSHIFSEEEEAERAKRRQQRVGGRGGGVDTEVEVKYPEPCGRETLEVMRERWNKLHRDFFIKKSDTYDLSKIPDIHDCIRYDALHNSHLNLTNVRELLDIASSLAHALVPQEYGINVDEKVAIGSAMCRTLLIKIRDDLDLARGLDLHSTYRLNPSYASDKQKIKSTHRSVRTRLYFTSESHLHTLLNVLRFGRPDCPVPAPVGDEAKKWIEGIPEFCYMTHFVVRVFERFQFAKTDPQRYRLEISLSPGADQDPLSFDMDHQLDVAPLKIISRDGLACQELVDYLDDTIAFAEKNELAERSKSRSKSPESVASSPEGSQASTPAKRTGYLVSNTSSTSSNDE